MEGVERGHDGLLSRACKGVEVAHERIEPADIGLQVIRRDAADDHGAVEHHTDGMDAACQVPEVAVESLERAPIAFGRAVKEVLEGATLFFCERCCRAVCLEAAMLPACAGAAARLNADMAKLSAQVAHAMQRRAVDEDGSAHAALEGEVGHGAGGSDKPATVRVVALAPGRAELRKGTAIGVVEDAHGPRDARGDVARKDCAVGETQDLVLMSLPVAGSMALGRPIPVPTISMPRLSALAKSSSTSLRRAVLSAAALEDAASSVSMTSPVYRSP